MVISLELKPASLQEISSSEYLLVFLATAASKQSSKGTVSSMMVIADWSHTTRLGRLSVRAICCGKLYWGISWVRYLSRTGLDYLGSNSI